MTNHQNRQEGNRMNASTSPISTPDEQPEITVPVIEIVDGFTVDDILTEDDCDDAQAILTAIIARIEERLDLIKVQGLEQSIEYIRAKTAPRYKRAALQINGVKRGKFNRLRRQQAQQTRDRQMLDWIRQRHPDVLQEAITATEFTNQEGNTQ